MEDRKDKQNQIIGFGVGKKIKKKEMEKSFKGVKREKKKGMLQEAVVYAPLR